MLARVVSERRKVIETSWDFLANIKQAQHASKLESPLRIVSNICSSAVICKTLLLETHRCSQGVRLDQYDIESGVNWKTPDLI